ncbi:MAG: TonB-dependent receptor plug domain-containing protein [Phocaeicola vulgatus]|nr:MAG: TonB-dependent receptor plug domain-containing protein [Phocaeicola vulgatus]
MSFRINKTDNGEIYTIYTDELLPDSLKNRISQVTTNVYEITKGTPTGAEKSAKEGKTEVHVDVLSTKPLIILDGEEYNGSLNDIKPEDIKSVNVYKAGNEVANAYGEKGKNGVMKIFTKASEDSISYIINGKPASSKEMKEISSSNISSVTVLKRGSEAALNHGEIGKRHNIVIIKTK